MVEEVAHGAAVGQLRLLRKLLDLVQDLGGVKAEADLSFNFPEALPAVVASVVDAVVVDSCLLVFTIKKYFYEARLLARNIIRTQTQALVLLNLLSTKLV